MNQAEELSGRFFAAFLTKVLLNELRKHFESISLDLRTVLREPDDLSIQRLSGSAYPIIPAASDKQLRLLRSLDLKERDLQFFADQETARLGKKTCKGAAKMLQEGRRRKSRARGGHNARKTREAQGA